MTTPKKMSLTMTPEDAERWQRSGRPTVTLATLTDAHVRALLDPPGCSYGDLVEAGRARLVLMVDGKWHGTVSHVGRLLLSEAQRIAEGLTPELAAVLRAAVNGGDALVDRRLVERGLRVTPAARLVLALRERAKATPCPECEGIGEHESQCREDPDWEPSDDDLDLNGEGVAARAEAERRALREAGR